MASWKRDVRREWFKQLWTCHSLGNIKRPPAGIAQINKAEESIHCITKNKLTSKPNEQQTTKHLAHPSRLPKDWLVRPQTLPRALASQRNKGTLPRCTCQRAPDRRSTLWIQVRNRSFHRGTWGDEHMAGSCLDPATLCRLLEGVPKRAQKLEGVGANSMRTKRPGTCSCLGLPPYKP